MALDKNEQFALELAEQVASAGDLDILAGELQDLAERAGGSSDLRTALAEMRQFDQQGGDFGAEIVGVIVVPALIEVGKQLWAKYVEKMVETGAAKLANLTVDEVRLHVVGLWKDSEESVSSQYEQLLRAEAKRQGLKLEQIEGLLTAVRNDLGSHERDRP
jgi:hypothetical protein